MQSEVEGVDSESVGFYGRCALHAMYNNGCVSDSSPIDIETGNSLENDSTCARTEVTFCFYIILYFLVLC